MKSFLMSVISVVCCICNFIPNLLLFPQPPQTDSVAFAQKLGPGWNLGNTLDAWSSSDPNNNDTETCWGNPKTTKEIIHFVKKSGFNTVRIPITWFPHVDEEYNIDKQWLDRVNEIVDYVLDSGMYAIINVHHDDKSWLIPDNENEENTVLILKKIWSQVAQRFASYDERLIFETMNEPRVVSDGGSYEWQGVEETRGIVNHFNAVALETIRNGGGNNKDRYVFITTYAAGISKDSCNSLRVPDDSRVMVSLHYYYETAHQAEWFDCEEKINLSDKWEMYKTFRHAYNKFVKKGIGVCITEFGWTDRENIENLSQKAETFVNIANKLGMSCIVWDDGGNFQILDRRNCLVKYQPYVDAII